MYGLFFKKNKINITRNYDIFLYYYFSVALFLGRIAWFLSVYVNLRKDDKIVTCPTRSHTESNFSLERIRNFGLPFIVGERYKSVS